MPVNDVSGKSLAQLISLEGQTAVVTGAARGIGLAIARRLAEAGADLVLGDIDADMAATVAGEIAAEFGVRAVGTALDVADEAAIIALADQAVALSGSSVDFLASQWDEIQDINLRGTFLGAREAARRMIAQDPKGGVIVNVASVSGFRGRPGLAAYVASKHGVVGLTKSLAVELGPHDIRVLGLAPTGTSTPGLAARRTEAAGAELDRIKMLEKRIADSLPLGRLGVPDDIARVALFCASDLSLLMTGSTLLIDAGALAN
jgi:NAD(P)-dependent dehydrogenase (short-subunit alcohol dehydrogenase family)